MLRRCFRLGVGVVAIAMLLAFAAATRNVVVADEPVPPPQTTPLSELALLAESGRFDKVLASLKTVEPQHRDPSFTRLLEELRTFEAQRAKQDGARREAYAKALQSLDKHAKAGRIEDALISAIEAHGLADSSEQLLKNEPVASLVKNAEAAVTKAEKEGDWIESLNLCRVLDLLFDDYATYREPLRRANRHVRVLRLYAPDELERLLRQRADRITKAREEAEAAEGKPVAATAPGAETKPAKKASDAIRIEREPWQQRLTEVEPAMLIEALRTVARRHVASRGYSILLKGGADSLLTLVDTKAAAVSFPSLGDDQKVQRFRESMLSVKQDIAERVESLDSPEASTRDRAAGEILDRMLNAATRTLEVPRPVAVYEMTEGAIDTLDEFSAVIWPSERDSFRRNFDGKFYGVGVQISLKDERIIVVSPLEDTPAHRAGLKAGDAIVAVNGRDTTGWSLDQAVREITGPEGTPVTLGIERVGKGKLEFKLKRAEIAIESIRGWQHKPKGGWDYYIDPDSHIGYVRLTQFIPQTADDLDNAINQMEKEGGCEGLILDLRFNPGGLLSSAVEVVDRFVQNGIIVSTVGPPDTRTSQFYARPDHTHHGFPVVVLINQGSASASEIVSGALQDYNRATIIGIRSFGKGSVQDVFPIDSQKAYLKLTTQHYKLPKGRIIHRMPEARSWGIEPTLKVPMTNQQVADLLEFRQKVDVLNTDNEGKEPQPVASDILHKGMDPQLASALLVLQTRRVAQRITIAQGGEKRAVETR